MVVRDVPKSGVLPSDGPTPDLRSSLVAMESRRGGAVVVVMMAGRCGEAQKADSVRGRAW